VTTLDAELAQVRAAQARTAGAVARLLAPEPADVWSRKAGHEPVPEARGETRSAPVDRVPEDPADRDRRAYQLLRMADGATGARVLDLAASLGCTPARAWHSCFRLEAQGHARRSGRGRFAAT